MTKSRSFQRGGGGGGGGGWGGGGAAHLLSFQKKNRKTVGRV